jgi:hypothetical protein
VLECWSIGVLEYWSIGVLECWSIGVLECWSVGVLECWGRMSAVPMNIERVGSVEEAFSKANGNGEVRRARFSANLHAR